jgi:hypothetical protein
MKQNIVRQYKIAEQILKDIKESYLKKDGRYGKLAYQIQKQECVRLKKLLLNVT